MHTVMAPLGLGWAQELDPSKARLGGGSRAGLQVHELKAEQGRPGGEALSVDSNGRRGGPEAGEDRGQWPATGVLSMPSSHRG